MKKQIAVEWLVEKLENEATMDYSFSEAHKLITLDIHSFNKLIKQAKAMEKEQIVDAYNATNAGDERADEYYNETYGGGEE